MESKLQILHLEDNPRDAELIEAVLLADGVDCFITRVADEASFRSALKDKNFDVVLSDYNLPSFNGVRAFQVFRELGMESPFVFVSGAIGIDLAVQLMKEGANDYVLKDKLVELPSVVRRTLAEYQERKKRQEAEELLIKITNAVPGVVYRYCLHPDGRQEFLFVSEGAKELFGYDAKKSVDDFGAVWDEILPEDAEGLMASIQISAKTRQPWSYEFRLKNPNGKVRWILGQSRPESELLENGSMVWNGILSDITERKSLENQLIQSQKMDTVGQLAGGIAHDFNNLLTVINGYSQMIYDQSGSNAPITANIEEILKAGKRAQELVKQLLIFSRKQVFQPKVIHLDSLIQDMSKMLRRLIPENIEVVTLPSPDSWVVRVDTDAFHQVLTNLAVNASHAMPHGGKLMIETKNVVLDSEYAKQHQDVPPGEYVLLAVSDTGTGMSDEVKAHLFEPFFTTKEKGKGTGLGLSTIYGIVKQSGGYIQVYSELGHGTSFKIYLPRVEAKAQAWYDSENPKPLPRGSETVLFVEDDEAVRRFGVNTLRAQGYDILEASSGETALDLLKNQAAKTVQILVADLIMPGMSGQELVEKIKSLIPGIRVLFASGYTENAIFRSGNMGKDEAFLQKPYSPRALAFKIREILDR